MEDGLHACHEGQADRAGTGMGTDGRADTGEDFFDGVKPGGCHAG